jgi:hypothetical protein
MICIMMPWGTKIGQTHTVCINCTVSTLSNVEKVGPAREVRKVEVQFISLRQWVEIRRVELENVHGMKWA